MKIWREQHNGQNYTLTRDEQGREVGKLRDPQNPREVTGNDRAAVDACCRRMHGKSLAQMEQELDAEQASGEAKAAQAAQDIATCRAFARGPAVTQADRALQALIRVVLRD